MSTFKRIQVKYEGEIVDLVERYYLSEENAIDHIPTVIYEILLHGTNTVIGNCDLRLVMNDYMYYYGGIGYDIKKEYQGHGYAGKACEVLFKVAKDVYGMEEIIVTCSPDNVASFKTLMKLGGEYLGDEDVPKSHELYWKGETKKSIFKFEL